MKTEWEANADAARRREPTVGQEAVSSRSRMRRLVRSQWFTPRHGRLNAACCLSAEGVATTKQRLDRAVGPAAAPCAQIPPQPQRFFNELKSHPVLNSDFARIATTLGIRVDSVGQNLSAIFTKLGAANRAEAIAIALRKQLLKV